jgi:hypothetical protein
MMTLQVPRCESGVLQPRASGPPFPSGATHRCQANVLQGFTAHEKGCIFSNRVAYSLGHKRHSPGGPRIGFNDVGRVILGKGSTSQHQCLKCSSGQ